MSFWRCEGCLRWNSTFDFPVSCPNCGDPKENSEEPARITEPSPLANWYDRRGAPAGPVNLGSRTHEGPITVNVSYGASIRIISENPNHSLILNVLSYTNSGAEAILMGPFSRVECYQNDQQRAVVKHDRAQVASWVTLPQPKPQSQQTEPGDATFYHREGATAGPVILGPVPRPEPITVTVTYGANVQIELRNADHHLILNVISYTSGGAEATLIGPFSQVNCNCHGAGARVNHNQAQIARWMVPQNNAPRNNTPLNAPVPQTNSRSAYDFLVDSQC